MVKLQNEKELELKRLEIVKIREDREVSTVEQNGPSKIMPYSGPVGKVLKMVVLN